MAQFAQCLRLDLTNTLAGDVELLVDFARAIARDARKITSGQVEALTRIHGFTDAQVFDIAAIAAGRSFFTKLLDALGTEPDVSFMAIDPELRENLRQGRAISHNPVENTTASTIVDAA